MIGTLGDTELTAVPIAPCYRARSQRARIASATAASCMPIHSRTRQRGHDVREERLISRGAGWCSSSPDRPVRRMEEAYRESRRRVPAKGPMTDAPAVLNTM